MRDHRCEVVPEQIALYQTGHLLTQDVCRFDPEQAVGSLRGSRDVMAIDIGGDKIRSAIYAIRDGRLTKGAEETFQSRRGVGYLAVLERLADHASANDLPVGISSATKLDGSIITRTVNLPVFFEELIQRYDADYRTLFPGRSFVANDTIMGICGATALLALQGIPVREAAFFISASGLGGSVIKDTTAIHVEVGHVPLVDRLNPLGQTTRCGVEGRDHVCVERVTAARAGIEDLYLQQTGIARDGITLGKLYEEGDALSTLLYETSALVLSHAVIGVMDRYAFSRSTPGAVVLHGGNFEVAKYRRAVERNVERLARFQPRIVFSRDLSGNVCLDGAAVMAACSSASGSG